MMPIGPLGRLPAKRDPHALRISKYLTAGVRADPPARRDWIASMTNIGPMKNDVLGCCTVAAAAHMIQAWTASNGAQVIIPDDEIVKIYSAVGGYVPGDPSTDNGAYMLDVLKYWRDVGFVDAAGKVHKILGWVALNPKNRKQMAIAGDLFGGVYVGLDLPLSAQRQEVWATPEGGPVGDGLPRSWGGHAECDLNYGPVGRACITWGDLKTKTHDFDDHYAEEAYACASADDWAQGGHAAPSGVLIDELLADMQAVAGLSA